jgi:hypothetical protein
LRIQGWCQRLSVIDHIPAAKYHHFILVARALGAANIKTKPKTNLNQYHLDHMKRMDKGNTSRTASVSSTTIDRLLGHRVRRLIR